MSVTLSSHTEFCAALRSATSIVLSAYVLQASSDVCSELERAADRGAHVEVLLDGLPPGSPVGDRAEANRRVATELRDHGVRVELSAPDGPSFHMKAALVDGAAYLDDRNWPATGRDTVVRTDSREDVAVVASALAGTPAADACLATDKARALALEAAAIRSAPGDRIDVETESFGGSPVSAALRERATLGAHVRLIVARRDLAMESHGRERALLANLATAGVSIRTSDDAEKLCAAGDRAWLGSANATYAGAPMSDWGLATEEPSLVAAVADAFDRSWARARPLV